MSNPEHRNLASLPFFLRVDWVSLGRVSRAHHPLLETGTLHLGSNTSVRHEVDYALGGETERRDDDGDVCTRVTAFELTMGSPSTLTTARRWPSRRPRSSAPNNARCATATTDLILLAGELVWSMFEAAAHRLWEGRSETSIRL